MTSFYAQSSNVYMMDGAAPILITQEMADGLLAIFHEGHAVRSYNALADACEEAGYVQWGVVSLARERLRRQLLGSLELIESARDHALSTSAARVMRAAPDLGADR